MSDPDFFRDSLENQEENASIQTTCHTIENNRSRFTRLYRWGFNIIPDDNSCLEYLYDFEFEIDAMPEDDDVNDIVNDIVDAINAQALINTFCQNNVTQEQQNEALRDFNEDLVGRLVTTDNLFEDVDLQDVSNKYVESIKTQIIDRINSTKANLDVAQCLLESKIFNHILENPTIQRTLAKSAAGRQLGKTLTTLGKNVGNLAAKEPLNWPSKAVYTGSAWP